MRYLRTFAVLAALLAIAPATASASSTASKIKTLQRQVKVLNTQMRNAASILGCMQLISLSQYGTDTTGYAYGTSPFDPATVFMTTAIDATPAGETGTAFFAVSAACAGRSSSRARSFGPLLPFGTISRSMRAH